MIRTPKVDVALADRVSSSAPAPSYSNDVPLSDAEFETIAGLARRTLGIKMPPTKRTMIASRLLRRLRALEMSSFRQYCAFLRTERGEESELGHLCDLLTTHKTEFFREPHHFDVLTDRVAPERIGAASRSCRLSIWSAGCSTGQEVYSIAMALVARLGRTAELDVLGTDVSETCLRRAELGVYELSEISSIPEPYRRRFLLRSRDPDERRFRIIPDLRACTRFEPLNFAAMRWEVEPMDAIFFRNVLIYFAPAKQEELLAHICQHLKPDGYLFLSHSETITGLTLPLTQVDRSVFRLR